MSAVVHIERPPLTAEQEAIFQRDMLAAVPRLRAAAIGICRGRGSVEDLMQDTLEKAWKYRANFAAGTNMVAWLCTIARNQHYTEGRRAWRTCELDQEVAERTLVATDDQTVNLDLEDLMQALGYLPREMQEALRLVVSEGLSYEEAAARADIEVGTVKSRVSRGRRLLDKYFGQHRRRA